MARPMPAVEIVDLRMHLPDPESFLSARLRDAIAETLAAGDQVILFLNRRGFATFVLCRACGHAFRCPNCSVSLTYHRPVVGITDVDVHLWVERAGRTSVTYRFEVLSADLDSSRQP